MEQTILTESRQLPAASRQQVAETGKPAGARAALKNEAF
jgi:hypothetical protein